VAVDTGIEQGRTIVVCGATGRQGGAVVRHLLAAGWHVRGLTRKASSPKARALADLGVEVVEADMADRAALDRALAGAYGAFSVQNTQTAGPEREVEQGRNVADAARAASVTHLVYGSAGIGRRTGIPSWDSKLSVEDHMRALALPVTVLRPMAFMELMTDRAYYPALSVWSVMPRLMGGARPVPWLAVDDVGAVAAAAFADPARFIGADLNLAGDVRTLDECRALWSETRGGGPRRIPIPVWMFERMAGKDLTTMWRWLRDGTVPLDPSPTREIVPGALTVRQWLERGSQSAPA
jgi:uncharacterized protein YbjT (DUF2867 family)